jgi:hypothetical protein
MATVNTLELRITADNKQALSSFNQTAKAMDGLNKTAANSRVGFNQASNALTNLGRVAQDAPFGFIGIANNLNPLLESFQRLQKETGSTAQSLKVLGASLMGAGGIGLALSAFQFFALGGVDALKKMFGATNEAKDTMKEFTKDLRKAETQAMSTGLQLQTFVNIAKNGNLPLTQRNEAIKQANKLIGDHAEKLTLVNINSQKTTDTVNQLTQAFLKQAIATKYADRVAELTLRQKELSKAFGDAKASYESVKKASEGLEGTIEGNIVGGGLLESKYKNLISATKEYKTFTESLKKETGEMNKALIESTQLFGALAPSQAKSTITTNALTESTKKLAEQKRLLGLQTYIVTAAEEQQNIARLKHIPTLSTLIANSGSYNDKQKETIALQQMQAEMVSNMLAPAFTTFFETLLSGGNAFDAFIQELKKLAVKLISTLLAALALQAVLAGLGIGGGKFAGKEGFGSILKMMGGGGLGSLLGFKAAEGGIATKPTIGMFGEAGPEVFMPLNKLPQLMGSMGGGSVQVQGVIRGSDIVLINKRGNQNLGFIG